MTMIFIYVLNDVQGLQFDELEQKHYERIARYLRKNLKVRDAVEYNKRVQYFKGNYAYL